MNKKGMSARQIELKLLGQMFKEHHTWLLRLLASRTGDPEIARDLVQETFLSAQQAVTRLNLNFGSQAYLKRIAVNLASRYRKTELSAIPTPDIEEQAVAGDNSESNVISSSINSALNRLPEQQKEVAKLRFFEKQTFHEVSRRLDISIRTAKRRMEAARNSLKKQLSPINPGRGRKQ